MNEEKTIYCGKCNVKFKEYIDFEQHDCSGQKQTILDYANERIRRFGFPRCPDCGRSHNHESEIKDCGCK